MLPLMHFNNLCMGSSNQDTVNPCSFSNSHSQEKPWLFSKKTTLPSALIWWLSPVETRPSCQ